MSTDGYTHVRARTRTRTHAHTHDSARGSARQARNHSRRIYRCIVNQTQECARTHTPHTRIPRTRALVALRAHEQQPPGRASIRCSSRSGSRHATSGGQSVDSHNVRDQAAGGTRALDSATDYLDLFQLAKQALLELFNVAHGVRRCQRPHLSAARRAHAAPHTGLRRARRLFLMACAVPLRTAPSARGTRARAEPAHPTGTVREAGAAKARCAEARLNPAPHAYGSERAQAQLAEVARRRRGDDAGLR